MTESDRPAEVARIARPLATWRLLAGSLVASAFGTSFLAGGARVDWPVWMVIGAGFCVVGGMLAALAAAVTRRSARRVSGRTGDVTYLLMPLPVMFATIASVTGASAVCAFSVMSFCDFGGRMKGTPIETVGTAVGGAALACLSVSILCARRYGGSLRVER